eukprot:Gb_32516 [translate_table: standard]
MFLDSNIPYMPELVQGFGLLTHKRTILAWDFYFGCFNCDGYFNSTWDLSSVMMAKNLDLPEQHYSFVSLLHSSKPYTTNSSRISHVNVCYISSVTQFLMRNSSNLHRVTSPSQDFNLLHNQHAKFEHGSDTMLGF